MARNYFYGFGIKRSERKAFKLWQKGTKLGSAEAEYYLGLCYSNEGMCMVHSYKLPDGYIQGTTGAGDAFCAGALLGIYEDVSDMDILDMATIAATGALSAADATSGLKAYSKLQEICKDFQKRK